MVNRRGVRDDCLIADLCRVRRGLRQMSAMRLSSQLQTMNCNQLNAMFRSAGLSVRLIRGRGYYYWSNLNAPSVYVYRASDLAPDRWMELALEAESFT